MKMFEYSFQQPEGFKGTSFTDRVNHLRSIGKEAEAKFQIAYPKLASWFKEYDSLYLLAFCHFYFLIHPADYDEEVATGKLEFPPHFQEILQALSLFHARTGSPKPLANEAYRLKKEMREVGNMMLHKLFNIPADLKSRKEIDAYRLRTDMMGQTLAVRSWAYETQMKKVVDDLCESVGEDFTKVYGFTPRHYFELFYLMVEKVNERVNAHLAKLRLALVRESFMEIYNAYQSAFNLPENTPVNEKKLKKMFGDIENYQAMLMMHSDLFLADLFSFSIEELLGLSDKKLDPVYVEQFMESLSFSFGEMTGDPSHILYNNPVHNKPFIKTGEGRYFSTLWGVLPHISIQVLENFVEADSRLAKKYRDQKALYLESELKKLFTDHFPGAQIYAGSKWLHLDGKIYENDLLVLIGEFAIIVEAKSGTLSGPAKRGAPERLFKNLKLLIEDPSEQALRFIDYIQNGSSVILSGKKGKKFTLQTDKIKYCIPVGITFSQLGIVSSNLKMLVAAGVTEKPIESLIPSMSLTDLQIVFDLLPTEAEKIHYFQRRRELELEQDYLGDEMDLFAFYLDNGFNLEERTPDNKPHLNLVLKSKELDPYYLNMARGLTTSKPQRQLTKLWRDSLEHIRKRKFGKWLEMSYILLNFPYELQAALEKDYEELVHDIKNNNTDQPHNWISIIHTNESRQFVFVIYPYTEALAEERNEIINQIFESLDSEGVMGMLLFAINIDKPNYPYNAAAISPASRLFDSRFLIKRSSG